jgi:hypothetical protein
MQQNQTPISPEHASSDEEQDAKELAIASAEEEPNATEGNFPLLFH